MKDASSLPGVNVTRTTAAPFRPCLLLWCEGARLDPCLGVGRSCLSRTSVAYATERAMAFYSKHRDRDRIREELAAYLAALKLETN